jgi:response regulator RpfG family c-di-GMP phosphodiesterase
MAFSYLFSKILIVDDNEDVRESLKLFLEAELFTVRLAVDGEDALLKVNEFKPDCILLDIKMPYLSGVEALKMIKYRSPNTEVIMISTGNTIQTAVKCLLRGAFGILSKPIDLDKLLKEIKLCLEKRHKKIFGNRKKQKEEREKIKQKAKAHLLNKEFFHALRFPLHLASYLDSDFANHSIDVSWLCEKLAIQLNSQHIELTNLSGLYHDIGKLCLPKYLLQKHCHDWTVQEKQVFKRFPIYSEELAHFHFRLHGLKHILRHQCENVDGTGFPDGLSGDDIPQESKIISVANAFIEIMDNEKLGLIEFNIKKGIKILENIKKDEGKLYDVSVVSALEKFIKIYKIPDETSVGIIDLEPGMELSRDLYTKSGRLILPKGMRLDIKAISKIIDLNFIDPINDKVFVSPSK